TWDQIHMEAYRALGLEPRLVHLSSELIAEYWPHAKGSLIGDKSNSVVFDNTKIKNLVPDFHCEVNWAEGLRRVLAWYEQHPQFKTIDEGFNALCDRLLAARQRALPVTG
ncbi:MAG TPA: hypothetical protein VIV15_17565, partial [Anaerolineales bacterium]